MFLKIRCIMMNSSLIMKMKPDEMWRGTRTEESKEELEDVLAVKMMAVEATLVVLIVLVRIVKVMVLVVKFRIAVMTMVIAQAVID